MRDQLLLGACEDHLPKIEVVDAIVTDPPYGLGKREPTPEEIDLYLAGSATLNTGGDVLNKDWDIPSVSVWRECFRLLKNGGLLLSFGGTRTVDLISLGIQAAGFRKLGTLLWVHGQGWPKGGKLKVKDAEGQLSDGWGTQLKPAWEPVVVFSKGKPRIKVDFADPFFFCAKAAKSDTRLDGEQDNDHPTVKPVKLMRHLVALSSKPGAVVLDPYVGSGTTAEASLLEGRHFLAIERDPAFYEIARKRIELAQKPACIADIMDQLGQE